ncbi:MAG: rhodanese-like domain-containing protein [Solirubrobacterales bacterium]|nr:rhodanese-like domain-containing protein [Solirubrobacterales bacterium]
MSATAPRPAAEGEIELEPEALAGWLAEERPVQLVDVREPHEREAGHIEGSRHVPLAELPAQASSLERGRPVVFYCRVGERSAMAAQALRTAGFEAYSMRGGLVRWHAEERPLAPDGGYVADH